ncbi:MAG: hypothetical protein ACRC34_02240, partial [Cetobacterium sp.]
MKKQLLLLSFLALANTSFADENTILGVPSETEETLNFGEKQLNFVNSIKEELETTKLELKKYKTEAEKNAAIVKKAGKKWNHEVYFGVEQEINSDNDWKFLDGSLATSPYTGMFLYQDDSKLLYDIQFLKT